jgi:hypothetical protein
MCPVHVQGGGQEAESVNLAIDVCARYAVAAGIGDIGLVDDLVTDAIDALHRAGAEVCAWHVCAHMARAGILKANNKRRSKDVRPWYLERWPARIGIDKTKLASCLLGSPAPLVCSTATVLVYCNNMLTAVVEIMPPDASLAISEPQLASRPFGMKV